MFNKKIIGINIFILFILSVAVETISLAGRFVLKKPYAGFIVNIGYKKYLKQLKNPCNRMVSHPLLGHTHEINDQCIIRDGKVIGPYVIYKYGESYKDTIITLGGSTTDGFFNHINNGVTWSTEFSKLLDKNKLKFSVLNGGTGAYSSSNELMKLLIDLPRIRRDKNVKYIISFNGVNDLPGYRTKRIAKLTKEKEAIDFFAYKFPIWNYYHLITTSSQKYMKQTVPINIQIMPSTNTLIQYLFNNPYNFIAKSKKSWLKNYDLPFGNFDESNKYKEAANQWEYNVTSMNAIADSIGAKYFVFLQPTMGLIPEQVPLNKDTNDYKIYNKRSELYYQNINNLYRELRPRCKELKFCIDISDKVTPEGDLYNDPRHHNEKGNKKLARIIFDQFISNK